MKRFLFLIKTVLFSFFFCVIYIAKILRKNVPGHFLVPIPSKINGNIIIIIIVIIIIIISIIISIIIIIILL